jgi:hypothetical protein
MNKSMGVRRANQEEVTISDEIFQKLILKQLIPIIIGKR